MCTEILLITGDFTWTAHQIVTPEGFLSFLTPLAYSARWMSNLLVWSYSGTHNYTVLSIFESLMAFTPLFDFLITSLLIVDWLSPVTGLFKRIVQFLSSPLYTDPADCIEKRRKLERKMLKSGLQSDITVKAGQAYPPRFYKWIDFLKNESVSRSRNWRQIQFGILLA